MLLIVPTVLRPSTVLVAVLVEASPAVICFQNREKKKIDSSRLSPQTFVPLPRKFMSVASPNFPFGLAPEKDNF